MKFKHHSIKQIGCTATFGNVIKQPDVENDEIIHYLSHPLLQRILYDPLKGFSLLNH